MFSSIGGSSFATEAGYDYANTQLTSITAAGSSNTVGSYVEMISAANNTRPSSGIIVNFGWKGSTSSFCDILLNVAIGGAGSEEVIIPNLMMRPNQSTTAANYYQYYFPIDIPAGVRISINCQASVASRVTGANIILISSAIGQDNSFSFVDDIGSNTGSSTGTTVARSTADTFGSWVQISSSTTNNVKGFIVAAARTGISWSTQDITYQVGIGSSGNEEIIFEGQHIRVNFSEGGIGHVTPFIPVEIPAGSRVAIRAQSDLADVDGDLDYIIYGAR